MAKRCKMRKSTLSLHCSMIAFKMRCLHHNLAPRLPWHVAWWFKLAMRNESVPEYLKSSLYITPMIPAMDCCATVPKSDSLCAYSAALPFRLAVHYLPLELRKLLF